MTNDLRILVCLTFASLPCLAGCSTLHSYSPLALLERSLVFQPVAYPNGNWHPEGLPIEDVWFESADGVRLHGWYLRHEQPRAVVLFCHGNAENITPLADSLAILVERHGLSAMTFDYRGYGRSAGTPTEDGILADARAARKWLAEREGIAETDIILMGRSLGGGVAVDLAAQDGARGLVLASTFTSLPEVAKEHVPWLPAQLLMTTRLNSLSKIVRYRGPVLISHGDADEVVPFRHGKLLFEAALQPKQFIAIPGGMHNDPQPESYRQALDEFIDRLPPLGSSRPAFAAVHVSVTE